MSFELFIALRYLFTRRKHGFISVTSFISVIGVALGVAALIVVLGVMNGFSTNLRNKILGVNAHIIVSNARGAFSQYQNYQNSIEDIPGIVGAMPFIYTEIMLSTSQGIKGAALRGIDPNSASKVLNLKNDLVQGSFSHLSQKNKPAGIIVGQAMAHRLGINIGDTVNVLTPSGKKTATGFTPDIVTFQVVGIFETGMYEYDSSLAYVSLDSAQDLLSFKKDLVTGLEVRLKDIYSAQDIATKIKKKLGGFPFVVQTWMDMNKSLLSALKLEKTAMSIILVMIVLVGSFSIITTLIMLVIEKKQDIAILMSLGAKPHNIRCIFMWQGSIIGFIGTFLGFITGLGTSFLLQKYQFIQLPSDIYYLDHLPVRLEIPDLCAIGVAALIICFLATLYPAQQAAKMQPAETLRYE